MADSNVLEQAEEVMEAVNEIPVTVVKTSNKGKVILGVAITGIVVGAAVGITKLMKKKSAVKEINTVDNELDIDELADEELD